MSQLIRPLNPAPLLCRNPSQTMFLLLFHRVRGVVGFEAKLLRSCCGGVGWEHERSFYSSPKNWLNDQTSLVVDSWSRDHHLPILQGHVIQVHGHQPDRSFLLPECGSSNKLSTETMKKPKSEEEDIMYGPGSNGSQSDLEIQAAVRGISFANDYETQFHQFSGAADVDSFSPLL